LLHVVREAIGAFQVATASDEHHELPVTVFGHVGGCVTAEVEFGVQVSDVTPDALEVVVAFAEHVSIAFF
jgi:hypothetical protein